MSDPKKIKLLYAKYLNQKSLRDPESQNTWYLILAEENNVSDISSFLDEIKYRWKSSPWLGGYNKYLESIPLNNPGMIPVNLLYKDKDKKNIETKSTSTPKKLQGGQLDMNEQQLQLAFIQFLAQKTGARNQLELEAAILLMGEEGLKLAYAEFMQMMQLQQVLAAKFGAKLNYIKSLRGQCPEGYEVSYYKAGGLLCKKCMKKQAMQIGGAIPQDPIDEFKCGRKMKKKAQGGAVDLEKCGGKAKKKTNKKENGGEINSTRNPAVFSKMALAKCGTKLKEACKGMSFDKCGNKLKKKKCCATGGTMIESDKCGKKLKKKAIGGTVNMVKCKK